jgi:hypothetical protein
MDQADIRGLSTALHRYVAGLPLSNVGDHRDGCPRKTFEDSPHRVRASRFRSGVAGIADRDSPEVEWIDQVRLGRC